MRGAGSNPSRGERPSISIIILWTIHTHSKYLCHLIVGRGIRCVVSRRHVIQGAEHVQDNRVNNMRTNLRLVKQRRNDPENDRH